MSTHEGYNPFQAPENRPQHFVSGPWQPVPFESGHQRAAMAITMLAITAVLSALGTLSGLVQYSSLKQFADGAFAPTGNGAAVAKAGGLISIVGFVVWIGTVVSFCLWTHRAARNLPALGARSLKYTPAWAVGWFFVPLANLVMPYFVAQEIWRNSEPARPPDGYRGQSASPLVAGWWFIYILHTVIPSIISFTVTFRLSFAIAAHNGNPADVREQMGTILPTMLLVGIASQALAILAAILGILYVRRVDINQEAMFERIAGEGFAR